MNNEVVSQFTPQMFIEAMRAHRAVGGDGPFIRMNHALLTQMTCPRPRQSVGELLSVAAGSKYEVTVDVQAPEWMRFSSVELYTHAPGSN